MMDKKQLVKKWENVKGPMSIRGIEDSHVKANLAQLLENQENKDFSGRSLFESGSDGSINTTNLDSSTTGDWRFRPVALALQRRTFPDLFANKVVGVQAMNTPVGFAFAIRFTYQKDGTGVEAGWDHVPTYGGWSGSPGTSAALEDYVGSSLSSASHAGIYDSSASGWAVSAAEALQIAKGDAWTATSTSGTTSILEGDADYNQLGFRIDRIAIEAKSRKLAASFSLEAAQDIKAMQGIDIEKEMVSMLQYEIQAELDRELLYRMKKSSVDTTNGGALITAIDVSTSGAGGIDGRWSGEKYMNLVASIIHQQNKIATATRRGPGNFVVVSPTVATALQAAGHQFVQYSQKVNPTTTMAAIGKLNGTMDVYRDQYASADYALVGFKGAGISDAGIIFSPYIMGLENRAISPDDFSPRIGVNSRYSISESLLGAGRYYRLLAYTNLSSLIPGA
jgi:hypothetical protein